MDGHLPPAALAPLAHLHTLQGLVLPSVPLDRPAHLRPLYWRAPATTPRPEPDEAGRITLPPGATLAFDTYFGALFEYQWRLYTRLGPLALRLHADHGARLRVWRTTPHCPDTLLLEQRLHPAPGGPVDIRLPDPPAHARQAGMVWFDLTALDHPVRLHAAAWVAPGQQPAPAALGIAICTFNREPELAALLARIADHAPLDHAVARITVVNQGNPGLAHAPALAAPARRLGARLRVLDQPNLGGAGGFGRGLLETLDDDAVTHVCFLDDDVALEPDCLLRMAAFFALANTDMALGGHMLDAVQPTRLYEAGAVVRPDWTIQPLRHGLDLAAPGTLATLIETTAMHFNGWWMFAFPKHLVHRLGMPLPCFIRGDDVEFGMRLHQAGVFTVPLPGVAIWHEPFYLKVGGWQLYYETRNALLCAALHQPFTRASVAVALIKRLLTHLLTDRYYGAALILHAIRHALAGPGFLAGDPRPIHQGLAALRDAHPQAWVPREAVLPHARVAASPRRRPGFLLAMARALLRNWCRPVPPGGPQALDVRDLVWFRVAHTDHLAVETHWDAQRPAYRRNRETFRRLFRDGLVLTWRLARAAPAWRAAVHATAATVTTIPFWRAYVGLPAIPPRPEQETTP